MVKVTGAKAHSARLKRLGADAERQVGAALKAAGELVEVEAAISITEGSVSGKQHVPSKPGEPPNADTGVLDGSIETVQVSPTKVIVQATAPYARALEFGTSKVAERPFMRPALAKKRKEVTALVQKAVAHLTRGGKVG